MNNSPKERNKEIKAFSSPINYQSPSKSLLNLSFSSRSPENFGTYSPVSIVSPKNSFFQRTSSGTKSNINLPEIKEVTPGIDQENTEDKENEILEGINKNFIVNLCFLI